MDLVIELDNEGRIWVSALMARPLRRRGSTEPPKHPMPYARVDCACLRKNIRQAHGRPPPWIRTKSPVSSG
jgi:hypothetical protein